jgi:light-harvesting complex 1 beta chain
VPGEEEVVAALVTTKPVVRDGCSDPAPISTEGMQMAENRSLSGLTEAEALEFHAQFKTTFTAFMVICVLAHGLVWAWKPWY